MSRGGYFKRILIVLGLLLVVLLPDLVPGSRWHPRNLSLWVLGLAGGFIVVQSLFRQVIVVLTIDYAQEILYVTRRALLGGSEWAVGFRQLRFQFREAGDKRPLQLQLEGGDRPVLQLSEADGFSEQALRAMAAALEKVQQQYQYPG